MKVKVTVKVVEERRSGTSKTTGNPWDMRSVVLEWLEPEGTQRVRASMFGRQICDRWESCHIGAGTTVEASLLFRTTTARSGFVYNEVELVDFNLPS